MLNFNIKNSKIYNFQNSWRSTYKGERKKASHLTERRKGEKEAGMKPDQQKTQIKMMEIYY